jgi:protein TonB
LHSGTYRNAPAWDATTVTRRGSGLALALAINLVILLVMLGLGAAHFRPRPAGTPLIVDLVSSPAQSQKPAAQKSETSEQQKRPKRPPLPPPPPIPVPKPLDMIELTREEYAAADIRKLGRTKGEAQQSAADDSQEVGRAPNGEVLYGAEWYRKPTDAELAGYLPRNAPEGWGLIACRTAPDHRVEDCVELDNFPRGSRLASAVRQAAWQFRVRAPRKNGQELIGAWVQIRIEYLHGAAR